MSDLAVALGLVLVIEGLLWALSPDLGRRLLAAAAATPEQSLRRSGWIAVAVGALIIWLVRG
ncbi:DUF2065 domain-containing protein [Hyphomicrobium sp.]|uniref:DUF2065 domain-containing protein n=1 Tax=Hyphomicrobium sp. TaxID=82 RepID=UPI002E37EACC|nr:DUF2065 domain-containing protein [Hyphomicrobium sp.]HEX2840226.1 DUF2065 domain-containing protein [Hyphomicrobium sp.]